MHRVSSNSAASDCVGTCTRHLLENNCGGSSSKVPYLQYWMVLDPPQVPTGQRFLKLWQLLKLWQPHIYTYIYIYHNIQHIYTRNKESTAAFSEAAVSIYSIGRVTDSHTSMLCETSPPSNLYILHMFDCMVKIFQKNDILHIYIYTDFLRFDVVQRCIENQKRMLISKGSAVCLWMWMPRYNRHWQSISKIITVYIQIYINIYTYIVYI